MILCERLFDFLDKQRKNDLKIKMTNAKLINLKNLKKQLKMFSKTQFLNLCDYSEYDYIYTLMFYKIDKYEQYNKLNEQIIKRLIDFYNTYVNCKKNKKSIILIQKYFKKYLRKKLNIFQCII